MTPEVFIVTAPSGTGKTTLNRRIMAEFNNVEISISHTTRAKRPGEEHGVHYWYMDLVQFENEIKAGTMLEWAKVFNNLYGTSLAELDRIKNKGHHTILEIDVQGWLQAKDKLKNAKSIFIMPPTLKTLWKRLTLRGTESLEVCKQRIKAARKELDYVESYQFFLINDDLEQTYLQLKKIFLGEAKVGLDLADAIKHKTKLIQEFEHLFDS